MSNKTQDKKKSGAETMRDLFYGIKQKQKPSPELNESVKQRRPSDATRTVPEPKAPERKIARPKPDADLDL